MMKRKLWDKTWKKCLWIFIIIFAVTFVGLVATVDYFGTVVDNNNIHQDIVVVKSKMNNDSYYTITDNNNREYIIDNDDGQIFDSIEVGNRYRIIVRETMNKDQDVYILQVHNDTS